MHLSKRAKLWLLVPVIAVLAWINRVKVDEPEVDIRGERMIELDNLHRVLRSNVQK